MCTWQDAVGIFDKKELHVLQMTLLSQSTGGRLARKWVHSNNGFKCSLRIMEWCFQSQQRRDET